MRNLPLKLAAPLLVLGAAAGPAAAEPDPKNYPGLACLASGDDITEITRNVNNGRALNRTDDEMTFLCPAIKDGQEILGATVFVLDRNPNQGVVCTLRSGRPQGPAQWFATRSTGPAFENDEPIQLEFPALQSVPLGFYWLTCSVPELNSDHDPDPSGIVMYQIIEGP